MNPMIVKCCAYGLESELHPSYPDDATGEQIRDINLSTMLWYQEYLRGDVFFLSLQAIDKGFRFHSTLGEDERGPYRFIRVLGTDLLCRHAKYFINPKDADDQRMVDDALAVVMPTNQKPFLTAEKNADKVVAPKNITVEGAKD